MSKKSFLFYLCTLGFVFIIIFSSFLKNERLSYCEYEDFDIRNESVEYSTYFDLSQGNLQQGFIAPGNRLTKVFLFFDKNSVIDVTAEVRDATGTKSLFSKTISKQGENSIGWQEFEFDFNGLKRGTEYLLCLKAKEHAFVAVIPERDSADDLLTELSFKEQTCPGALALKIQFSYQHYSPSKIVHMIMELLFRFFEVGMLCWAVGHIQMLWTFF